MLWLDPQFNNLICLFVSIMILSRKISKWFCYPAVAFARLFFPTEAKLAMHIAHTETTDEFSGVAAPKGSSGNLREVDLNETPVMQNRRLRSRLEALMKTGNCKILIIFHSDMLLILILIV